MGQSFRYWGFLSYSHADEAAATPLHRALEGYALPARVRNAHGLPRRLVPIFRDVEELEAASELNTRLQAALDDSRWLIVLCSPAAAQSKYVEAEIRHFISRHGAGRVLCALVSGEPPESFPPSIRALPQEPLAADLRPGRDPALGMLRLVAAMAGVGFTELRNREAERARRRRLAIAAAVAGAALAAVVAWDLLAREHVDHYRQYVREHGIWKGIDRIADADADAQAAAYRFTRHGRLNPPERVDYVNGAGRCADSGMREILGNLFEEGADETESAANRYCRVEFAYRSAGEVARERWLSSLGRPLETLAYTEDGLAQFTHDGFSSSASRGGIQYVTFSRDERGRDVELRFLHSRGVPRPNDARHFGYRFEYDAAGRVTLRSALDDAGAETGQRTRYAYDARGLVTEVKVEDAQGRPRLDPEGFASIRFEYDAAGNEVRRTAHDAEGRPSGVMGFAERLTRRDAHGRVLETSYRDAAGKPAMSRGGFSTERVDYDPRGFVIRLSWFGPDGRPTDLQEGVAAAEFTWNEQGWQDEARYYDAAGRPAVGVVAARVKNHYDANGLELKECFFDGGGQPVLTRWGHCIEREFDARGQILEFRFMGVDGKPVARASTATTRGEVVRNRFQRDGNGNITRSESFGADGKLTLGGKCHCARSDMTFDDFGNWVEARRYDAQGALIKGAEGWAVSRRRFDRSGNVIDERYFGPRGEPVAHLEGYYGFTASYDSRQRLLEKRLLGPDGAPRPVAGSRHASVKYGYTPTGEVSTEAYFDAAGAEFARVEYRHDSYERVTERRYLQASGEPAADPRTGCAVLKSEYAEGADPATERCLDAGGKPANRRDEGWAVRTVQYRFGRPVGEERRDAAGRLLKPPTG